MGIYKKVEIKFDKQFQIINCNISFHVMLQLTNVGKLSYTQSYGTFLYIFKIIILDKR